MDSLQAFAMGELHRNDRKRVFDWDRAAQLIAERKPEHAGAGLSGDWEWTGGSIYEYGWPIPRVETYTYLCSTWAIPELDLDGEVIDCWRYQDESPGWNAGTYWPASALAILGGTDVG